MSEPEEVDVWDSARRELDRWAEAGLKARFWLRDDDAVEVSEKLKRLRDLSAKHHIRIGLAVIPGRISPDLGHFLEEDVRQFYPMCHGWKHVNHNGKNRPAEFGPDRPISSLMSDAQSALQFFRKVFGSAKAIFVPPFNRATPALIKSLPDIGFFGVSLMPNYLERKVLQLGSRLNCSTPVKIPDFKFGPRIDVHIDVINWREKTAQETETIVNQIVHQLRVRRLGFLKADAPIGLLTHHLSHDERVWSLCERIVQVLKSHQSVEFLDVGNWADTHVLRSATRARSESGLTASSHSGETQ